MKKLLIFFLFFSFLFAYYEKMCTLIPDKIDSFELQGRCEGVDVNSNGIKGSQAVKSFVKNTKKFNIHLLSGMFAMQAGESLGQNLQINTDDVKIEVKDFEGFKSMMSYQKRQKGGDFIILLAPGKVMAVEFNNMKPEEVKEIVKKYLNLNKIKNF